MLRKWTLLLFKCDLIVELKLRVDLTLHHSIAMKATKVTKILARTKWNKNQTVKKRTVRKKGKIRRNRPQVNITVCKEKILINIVKF